MRLLLELLEASEPILSAAVAQLDQALADQLISHGLLVHHDFEDVTVCLVDHDDVPVPLVWSEQLGAMSYCGGSAGSIAVDKRVLRRWRVAIDRTLTSATNDLGLQASDGPFELIEGVVWEIGNARLNAKRPRTPIWFARRLWSPSVQDRLREAARNRAHVRQRVLLTSSRSDRVSDVELAGFVVVSLADVLASPSELTVVPEILSGRLGSVPRPKFAGPVSLSPDGRTLHINAEPPISFRSDAHIAAMRLLLEAYRSGEGVRVGDLTHLGSLRRLFGPEKWKLLSPYLRSTNGLWSLRP